MQILISYSYTQIYFLAHYRICSVVVVAVVGVELCRTQRQLKSLDGDGGEIGVRLLGVRACACV